jgi:predicted Zn-dependent protease with MMP-like domain
MAADTVSGQDTATAARRRSRWRNAGWGFVLLPLAVGLAFCGLGLWSWLVYTHNQADFQAHAVPARAVIDQLYTRNLNVTGTSFDQYGTVAFAAGGRTVHAQVLLGTCNTQCIPGFRTGQVLTVYYNPQNLDYAQLKPGGPASGSWWAIFLGLFGGIFIFAAVVNLVTRRRQPDRGPRDHPGEHSIRKRPLIDVEPDRFEDMVRTALDGLPEDLGQLMQNVAVTVEHDPGRPGLLGLYQGIPLTSRTTDYGVVLPDKITIYRQAICAICRNEEQVIEAVRRTVIHEVGHHFGIDDDRLRELGW